jgi:phenylalanyl-tRNA synthetase alpha chain
MVQNNIWTTEMASWETPSKNLNETIISNSVACKTTQILSWDHIGWINYLNTVSKNTQFSEKEISYLTRISKVLRLPDLSLQVWHPINMVVKRIIDSQFYKDYAHSKSPEIVWEWETFDLFNFAENHVARRPSDSYFLLKTDEKRNNVLLRPHTSVMWYYYLLKQGWRNQLFETGETKALSWWKVYRVDELDKFHHECFHQIDWLRITAKEKEIINQDTLKDVILHTLESLFWENVECRFNEDTFPYTTHSLEAEVKYKWNWMEVLWGWIVHPTVLEKLWIDPEKYNWWAYGFWLERLTMTFKWIPDIRIFWSHDKRITKQWWNFEPYVEVSSYPPVYKDISMLVPKERFLLDRRNTEASWDLKLTKDTESDFFAITWIIRDIWGDLIEEVRIVDFFENDKKFSENYKSLTIKIVFRSLERTLTNEEVNVIYFTIREKIERELWYQLR